MSLYSEILQQFFTLEIFIVIFPGSCYKKDIISDIIMRMYV